MTYNVFSGTTKPAQSNQSMLSMSAVFFDWLAARCSESHLSSFADTKTTALSTLVCVRLYHFWATITSNGSPYATGPLSCLVCLSVRLVYCGQTIGWMKMPLGREVCLGPGDIVLDGDPAPPPLLGGVVQR